MPDLLLVILRPVVNCLDFIPLRSGTSNCCLKLMALLQTPPSTWQYSSSTLLSSLLVHNAMFCWTQVSGSPCSHPNTWPWLVMWFSFLLLRRFSPSLRLSCFFHSLFWVLPLCDFCWGLFPSAVLQDYLPSWERFFFFLSLQPLWGWCYVQFWSGTCPAHLSSYICLQSWQHTWTLLSALCQATEVLSHSCGSLGVLTTH